MEIYKKGLFGKHKPVMFGLDSKEIMSILKALPEKKYFYVGTDDQKVFYESPEAALDKWLD